MGNSSGKQQEKFTTGNSDRLEEESSTTAEKLSFLSRLWDSAPAIAYLFDSRELEVIWCNKRHKEVVGYDPTGMNFVDEKGNLLAIVDQDQQIAIENIKAWRDQILPPSNVVLRLKDMNGKVRFFYTNHAIFNKDPQGKPKQILGVGLNVGKPVRSNHEKRMLYSENLNKTYQLLDQLSDREIQILKLMSGGLSYKELANTLNLSVDGIRYHIRNIYQKLEVNTRAEAITKSLKYRIIHP